MPLLRGLKKITHMKCLERCLAHRKISMNVNIDDDCDDNGDDDHLASLTQLRRHTHRSCHRRGQWHLLQDYCLGLHILLAKQRLFMMQQVKELWRMMRPTRISLLRTCIFKALLLYVTS